MNKRITKKILKLQDKLNYSKTQIERAKKILKKEKD